MLVIEDTKPVDVQRLKDVPTLPPTWIVERNTLINSKGEIIGKLNRSDATVKLFVLRD